jgi:hypothetical protein
MNELLMTSFSKLSFWSPKELLRALLFLDGLQPMLSIKQVKAFNYQMRQTCKQVDELSSWVSLLL